MRTALRAGAELDAIAHFSPDVAAMRESVGEFGRARRDRCMAVAAAELTARRGNRSDAMAKDEVYVDADGEPVRVSSPGKVMFPEQGWDQARRRRALPALRAGHPQRGAGAAVHAQALDEGCRRAAVLPEARAEGRARDHADPLPGRASGPHGRRARAARRDLDGAAQLHRHPPVACHHRRPRPPERAAHRPGPRRGRDLRHDTREVAAVCRELLEEARPDRLAEDLGIARHPHLRAHRAALGVQRRAPRRRRLRARGRATRAGSRDHRVVEGGAPRRLPRLQPERPRQDHRQRLQRARYGPCLRSVPLGRTRDDRPASARPARPFAERWDEVGDLAGGMDDASGRLDGLLALAGADDERGCPTCRGRRTTRSSRTNPRASPPRGVASRSRTPASSAAGRAQAAASVVGASDCAERLPK